MYWDWQDLSLLMINEKPVLASISGASVQLILSSLAFMSDRWRWPGVTDAEFDNIEQIIAKASEEIMINVGIGSIVGFTSTPPSGNWLLCDGSLYSRTDHPNLYNAIHSDYRTGVDNFIVPDLRGKFLLSSGVGHVLGQTGGSETVTLTEQQLARHRHGFSNYTYGIDVEGVGVPDPTGVGNPKIPTEYTRYSGDDQPHNNMPPFTVIDYYIMGG